VSFRVEWSEEAWEAILAFWLASTDHDIISQAVRGAGAQLSSHPLSVGESRDDHSLRVGFFPPLTIYFAVSPEEHLVRIVDCVARAR
jgi:hypothetical protein